MRDIGTEFFYVELLEECSIDALDDREVFHILQYNSQVPNGYNVVVGNPHKATNPEHTSRALKKYYDDPVIKQQHSKVHMNKFTPIDVSKNVARVEIKPISQKGTSKIVYMYIFYSDGSSYRRRYGGIHIDFKDSYNRCLADAATITPHEHIIDYVINSHDNHKYSDFGAVYSIKLVHQRMKELNLVAILIHSERSSSKRIVFGGKTIPFDVAYSRAMSFITNVLKSNVKVEIDPKVMATLSNCRRVP